MEQHELSNLPELRNESTQQHKAVVLIAYTIVSPLSDTTKLLRVKNDSISPATWLGAFFPSPSPTSVFLTT